MMLVSPLLIRKSRLDGRMNQSMNCCCRNLKDTYISQSIYSVKGSFRFPSLLFRIYLEKWFTVA